MSSSPTTSATATATRREHLLAVLSTIADPRHRRGVRHTAAAILAVGVAAVIAGARSYVAIGEWVRDQSDETMRGLGIHGLARPDESTIRRLFCRIDADLIDSAIGAYLWTRTAVVGGRRVIAIDGKTVRGARSGDESAPHLVAAFEHGAGAVLGQLAVDAKSNEIPCVRELLATFDLAGATVTLDAMHSQRDTAEAITAAGGDFVFTIKNNTPTLRSTIKALPWNDVPAHSYTESRHGRRTTRTIKVTCVPDWLDFPGAAQVAQLRRTITRRGKKTVEVVYLLTSTDHVAAPPDVLAAWIQGHWGIENRLHWVRDVTYLEDLSQVRTGNGPRVMATLRSTAISLLRLAGWRNIASGLRHHARHPERVIDILLTG